jgi:hypothetical protein
MLTAEYGGTGGRPIESGMVVEEPDIEIGAGVSSKGMSQLYEESLSLPILRLSRCQLFTMVHRSHSHSSSLHSNKPAHGD